MADPANINLDYEQPIKIAEGIYWVGFYDVQSGLHCNPYLIIDGEEAVLIDGGSRPDFPVVMMKILRTGLIPSKIAALIYSHFDPDLVGSVHNFESIINSTDLKIISDASNNMFIRHYYVKSPLVSLEAVNFQFGFSSGRRLQFIQTPYAHAQGSFMTFDIQTGVLFTGDIFGSYGTQWDLFMRLDDECAECKKHTHCLLGKPYCPILDMNRFHKNIMPSEKALHLAMKEVSRLNVKMIAPQHGSVLYVPRDIKYVTETLSSLQGVGIDRY